MGERLSEREVLFLQAMSEAEMLGTSRGLATPAAGSWGLWECGGYRWDWGSPGQAEWEALPMEERRMWVPESKREVPEPGDQLLFVDGQPVPRGELGEKGEQYDHSLAYSLLERAGLSRHDADLEDEEEADAEEDRQEGPAAIDGARAAKMLRRLLRLWTRTIAKPTTTGATEGLESVSVASRQSRDAILQSALLALAESLNHALRACCCSPNPTRSAHPHRRRWSARRHSNSSW